jgi:chromate reductase
VSTNSSTEHHTSSAEHSADEVVVLTIAGSLRAGSFNQQLITAAHDHVPAGIRLVSYNALRDVEPFDEDIETEGTPAGVAALRRAIRMSDAVLIATPEYNSSIPGQLKNALDWLSRSDTPGTPGLQGSALYGRPVGVASVSTGQFGAVWAADELRKVLKAQGARVTAEPVVSVPQARLVFGEDGTGLDGATAQRITELLAGLGEQVHMLRNAGVELRRDS